MKRYKQIDGIRAIAVLLVAMYHFWVVGGYKSTGIELLNTFLSYGGEIGVTLFFILSGFGIYCCLFKEEQNHGNIRYITFIKKRLKRIYPQYFACILILLLLSEGAIYISDGNLKSIFFHLLFIHNFFISTSGSINGVLWMMGVIFQFYLLSVILYKLVKKSPILIYIISIILTILLKVLIFKYLDNLELDNMYLFIYGRQLITALDNFLIGMVVAHMKLKNKKIKRNKWEIVKLISISLVFLVWILYGTQYGTVYSNTIYGYLWHNITAFLLGIMVWISININLVFPKWIEKIMLFIAKYEYGIYIWHLVIVNNLYSKSPIIKAIADKGYWEFAILMLMITIGAGYLSGKFLDIIRD